MGKKKSPVEAASKELAKSLINAQKLCYKALSVLNAAESALSDYGPGNKKLDKAIGKALSFDTYAFEDAFAEIDCVHNHLNDMVIEASSPDYDPNANTHIF